MRVGYLNWNAEYGQGSATLSKEFKEMKLHPVDKLDLLRDMVFDINELYEEAHKEFRAFFNESSREQHNMTLEFLGHDSEMGLVKEDKAA